MRPRIIASREQLLQVVRDRRDELDLSHETLDGITGLQGGYVSKLLADPPMRGFGEMSLQALLDALGMRIAFAVIVEDPERAERVRSRWRPRKRRPAKKASAANPPPENLWCVASNPQITMVSNTVHQRQVMANTKMIGARVKPDLEEQVKEIAARDRRTVSDWIRCRLEDAVAAARRQDQHQSEAA
ncbi:hypothetical protein E4K64_16495 [Bradyrhizobium frederickii]|uniref:Uncharacterized protein n=1 Tax=Bradyrhizobium frederickii TaxID=2560054 RepID=A0A4Y9P4I3_9BRAD|nr:hypothetical protein [Bradyrhizobium frederickii]TFV75301.1 hypothetical protein E4K64_16495 [Bradyrhizobium frederickii]